MFGARPGEVNARLLLRLVALAALVLRHVTEDLLDVSTTTDPTGLSTLRTLNR